MWSLAILAVLGICAVGCDGSGDGPCGDDPCDHGTCEETDDGFVCRCDDGWSGELCDVEGEGCERLDTEPPLWVLVDGYDEGDTATYECDAGYALLGDETRTCGPAGWSGEEPTCVPGPCADHDCENDATCEDDGEGGYTCVCAPGFEGERCETNIDDCTPDPCEHGGTCIDGVDGYVCDCSTAPGWQGARCDEDSPDCDPDPCDHGTCIEGEPGTGEFSCECDVGWEGTLCSTVSDMCVPNPCEHGGTCTMGDPGEYSCACAAGYEGDRCEINIDDCDPNPCEHGGTCTDGVASFSCTCPDGWSGERCEVEVSGCEDTPCLHGGTCTDTGPGTYECSCPAGYEGTRCEIDIDECAPAPCLHGGTCIDGVASFTCDCSTAVGWEGTLCEMMTDLCTPNPCDHGGGCTMDGPGLYHCTCIDGYTGDHCEIDPPTTHCTLTYDLVIGNGNDGAGYTDCNLRIRDTFWGLGDGTYAVGPGTLILRVPSDGATSPAPGTAEILYYDMAQEFTTSTAGITVTTDVDAASPELGETGNTTPVATGTLTLGATPTITWGTCTLPPGWNDSETSYTPDIVATGAGCLAPYRSVGVVNCHDASPLASCASGGLLDGDNPQDETWEQRLQTLTFTTGLASFDMPFMIVPNRTPSRTSVSWGGTLASTVCE